MADSFASEEQPIIINAGSVSPDQDPHELAAAQREAAHQADMMESYAKAAYEASQVAEAAGDYETAANMRYNESIMRGNASLLRGAAMSNNLDYARSAAALYGAGSIGNSAVGNMRAAANEAKSDAIFQSSENAAIYGTSNDYYSYQQFVDRSYASQYDLRNQLIANGEYTTSTDTYFNSVTEAQWRTYEDDLKKRLEAETDPEKKASLQAEYDDMFGSKDGKTSTQFMQLNDEAMKAHDAWADENPQLADEMHKMAEEGKLPLNVDGVPDPKLRESLAIIDADKFLEMEDRIKQKKERGEELTGEEKRADAWLQEHGSKLSQEEKDKIHQAAEGLKEKAVIERQKNEAKMAEYQEKAAKIREDDSLSPEQKEAQLKELRDNYRAQFQQTEDEIQKRVAQEKEQGGKEKQQQQMEQHSQQQGEQQQTRLDGQSQDHVAPGAQHATVAPPSSGEGANAEGAGQVHEIQASASSLTTTEPAKEYNRQDFAALLAGNKEVSGLLASLGVTGGQNITNDNSGHFSAVSPQNPQYVAQVHEALSEEPIRA